MPSWRSSLGRCCGPPWLQRTSTPSCAPSSRRATLRCVLRLLWFAPRRIRSMAHPYPQERCRASGMPAARLVAAAAALLPSPPSLLLCQNRSPWPPLLPCQAHPLSAAASTEKCAPLVAVLTVLPRVYCQVELYSRKSSLGAKLEQKAVALHLLPGGFEAQGGSAGRRRTYIYVLCCCSAVL